MAGRPQLSSRKGPSYQLAEFLNDNWDRLVGRTNEEVAMELGYRAPNMISMFRTGKTRVPLEKLPDIARVMKIDIAALLPLWFEQHWGERDDAKLLLKQFAGRVSTDNEAPLLDAARKASELRDQRWSPAQVAAVNLVLSDDDVRKAALATAVTKGLSIT
jgi:transcriptional regulator with XRE-family HTH domain